MKVTLSFRIFLYSFRTIKFTCQKSTVSKISRPNFVSMSFTSILNFYLFSQIRTSGGIWHICTNTPIMACPMMTFIKDTNSDWPLSLVSLILLSSSSISVSVNRKLKPQVQLFQKKSTNMKRYSSLPHSKLMKDS